MRRNPTWTSIFIALVFCTPWSGLAQTPGSVTFSVTTQTANGQYAPQHVLAIWITDGNGQFVQTLKKQAAARQRYLYEWIASSNQNQVDGITGATINSHQTHNLVWDCTDSTGALVPDGLYRIHVEFTERNGSGPWTANTLEFNKGSSSFSLTFPDQNNFRDLSLQYTPSVLPHDIAVTGIRPQVAPPNATVPIVVTVANQRTTAESFQVILSNLTAEAVIGSQSVASLPGNGTIDVSIDWDTTGIPEGIYPLSATAGPVSGETDVSDNSLTSSIEIRVATHDIAITEVRAPIEASAGTAVDVQVVVTNRGDFAESFTVSLTDDRDQHAVGSRSVTDLPGLGSTEVGFTWNTAGASIGSHKLIAEASSVPGESSVADNLRSTRTQITPGGGSAGSQFRRRMPITFPGYIRSTPLTNFPALVRLRDDLPGFDYDDFATPATGGDLRFTDAAGSRELPFEIEQWNPNGTSFVWVQVPVLLGASTTIWAQWGNPGDDALPAYTGDGSTWSEGYAAVWHMNGSQIVDSSPNGNDAVRHGNINATTGVITGGQYLEDQGEYLDAGSGFNGLTNVTVSLAFRGEDIEETRMLLNKYESNSNGWGLRINHEAVHIFEDISGGDVQVYSTGIADHTWYWVVGVIEFTGSGYEQKLYLNGQRVGSGVMINPSAQSWNQYGGNLVMGRRGANSSSWQYKGELDEVRISSRARGDDWIWACYQNQRSGSTLADYGDVKEVLPVHDIDVLVLRVEPQGTAIVGDIIDVAVEVENRGTQPEDFTVSLTDTNTGASLGSFSVSALEPYRPVVETIAWNTAGAASGSHGLYASIPPLTGETNIANNSAIAIGSIVGTGFAVAPAPAAAGLGGYCGAVASDGNLAYVGRGATLAIVDLTQFDNPVELGQVRLPGVVNDIVVAKGIAYTANGNAGIHIIDVAQAPWPVYRTRYDTSGHAHAVAVDGNRLIVADGVTGIRILDVTDPMAASLLGAFSTEGPARDVVLQGTAAYVLDQYAGLVVLDVSSPSSPQLLGRYEGLAHGVGLAIHGGNAYIVDGQGRLSVLNISSPATIALVGSLVLDGIGRDVAVSGSSLYAALGNVGLQVVNVDVPSSPTSVVTYNTDGEATAISLAGGGVVGMVADGFAGLQILDVSSPQAPASLGRYDEAARASDAVVAEGLAYVAAGEEGVRIYSLTNSPPQFLGRCASALNARSVAVSDGVVYIADHQYGLRIEDASDPTAPVPLATYQDPFLGVIRRVVVSGDKAVIAGPHHIALLDVSNPASPQPRDVYAPGGGYVFDIALSGDTVFAACGSAGVHVLDIGNPSSFAYLGGYDTPGIAQAVSTQGTMAYVADGTEGWLVLDVSSGSPAWVQSHSTPSPIRDLAVSGRIAHLSEQAVGLRLVDVDQPATPVSLQSFESLTEVMRVRAYGYTTYVAEDAAGLAILEARQIDLDDDSLSDALEQRIIDADPNDALAELADVKAEDDFDGDGMVNGDEQIAGTDATDPTSLFLITDHGFSSPYTLRWTSEFGKRYRVYRSTNLAEGFTLLQSDIGATPPENAYAAPFANDEMAFYIIVVE